ncbi:MAG: 5-oxoprolinase subunit PxpB [Chthoniobacterales bacterium]
MPNAAAIHITPLGDSALTVRVRSDFAADPERALREVAHVLRLLQEADLPGVQEVTPAFTTLGVFYDPARAVSAGAPVDDIAGWLGERIKNLRAGSPRAGKNPTCRVVEIPVCYAAEFAPDLAIVARQAGLSEAEVIATHSAAAYRVGCLGFAPGFPYLIGLPAALATPRRATPRSRVAAGSVAIGGPHTGIYPQQSPGGWNVIGRTPQRLFDASRTSPALLAAGDEVRFQRMTRSEFNAAKD